MAQVKSIKGTHDILPNQTKDWQELEMQVHKTSNLYGYSEIRTPIIETASLFNRGVGEETDIVSKEMYSWEDKDKSIISLRPELTAPVVRSYIQHNLGGQSPLQRLYYIGPSFRRERPQKGRQRQFHQFGVEAIGSANPEQDAEVISLGWDILKSFGIKSLELKLSSIGSKSCRENFKSELVKYLNPFIPKLSEVSQRRLEKNPLRILDTKNKDEIEIVKSAPKIEQFYTKDDQNYFLSVQKFLNDLEIPFKIDPLLVRGLDYYTQTTFEICSENLGAQDALLGGGRYNGLVGSLGGKDAPAVGFAAGMERVIIAAKNRKKISPKIPTIYAICTNDEAMGILQNSAKQLRSIGYKVICETLRRSMRSQMRDANKSNADYVMIIGDDEFNSRTIQLKDLKNGEQEKVDLEKIISYFKSLTF
jgi:histidyl-tRNA synthetase